MNQYVVLNAVGSDRPGLVDAISSHILQCGCNIEDSRMAVLGGEFAMLILVSGTAENTARMAEGAPAVGAKVGLTVHVKPTRKPGEAAGPKTIPYAIEAYAMDHPGIVQRVASFLAARQVNIRALDTQVSYAPITGLPLFSLRATLDIPSTTPVAELRQGLQAIGAQQNIDIDIRPAP